MKLNLIFSLFIFLLLSCQPQNSSKEVLFVCTHGAARSPIAAAYFNKIAKDHNINYHAVYRGTESDDILLPQAADGLKMDNFDIEGWKPSKVSKSDIQKAHMIITFDCNLPVSNQKKF